MAHKGRSLEFFSVLSFKSPCEASKLRSTRIIHPKPSRVHDNAGFHKHVELRCAARLDNGIWGAVAVGLFASIPGNTGTTGLFGGGGATLLIAQLVGILAVGAWTAATVGLMFFIIKATIGLQVAVREEEGLDYGEHGSVAYPDMHPVREPVDGGLGAAGLPAGA